MNTATINFTVTVPLPATIRRALERKAQRAGMSLEEYAAKILVTCGGSIPLPAKKTA